MLGGWRAGGREILYALQYLMASLDVSSDIVQELCESRGGRPGLSVLTSLLTSVDVGFTEPCFGIGLSLFLICQPTSEGIKHHFIVSLVWEDYHQT